MGDCHYHVTYIYIDPVLLLQCRCDEREEKKMGFSAHRLSLYPSYRYIPIIAISYLQIYPSYRYILVIDISQLSIYPSYRYIPVIDYPNYRNTPVIHISMLSKYPSYRYITGYRYIPVIDIPQLSIYPRYRYIPVIPRSHLSQSNIYGILSVYAD